jgi:hypothetical protein
MFIITSATFIISIRLIMGGKLNRYNRLIGETPIYALARCIETLSLKIGNRAYTNLSGLHVACGQPVMCHGLVAGDCRKLQQIVSSRTLISLKSIQFPLQFSEILQPQAHPKTTTGLRTLDLH